MLTDGDKIVEASTEELWRMYCLSELKNHITFETFLEKSEKRGTRIVSIPYERTEA